MARHAGFHVHTQGVNIVVKFDFKWRPGSAMASLRICPRAAASRWSQMASMCQFDRNFSAGFNTFHAGSMKSLSRAFCVMASA